MAKGWHPAVEAEARRRRERLALMEAMPKTDEDWAVCVELGKRLVETTCRFGQELLEQGGHLSLRQAMAALNKTKLAMLDAMEEKGGA